MATPPSTGRNRSSSTFSLRRLFYWTFCVAVALGLMKWFSNAVRDARRAAVHLSIGGNFKQMQVALHNYHDTYGCFPPAYIADANGVPMHSWRVLLVPYIDYSGLYDAYDFNEPWNGPNNSKLADQMPSVFHSDSEPESTRFTNIVAITGPGTAFPGGQSTSLSDFADGAENCIMLVEIADSQVNWMQPVDINVQQTDDLLNNPHGPSISAAPWRRPYVLLALKITTVAPNVRPEHLHALTTIAGGEDVTYRALAPRKVLENQGSTAK